jgi:hypothetical protein
MGAPMLPGLTSGSLAGLENGLYDRHVAGTAANIARNRFSHLRLGGMWRVVQKGDAGHEKSGGAKAALQGVMLVKGAL